MKQQDRMEIDKTNQQCEPVNYPLRLLISMILSLLLMLALLHAMVDSGVLIKTEKITDDSTRPIYDLEVNPDIFVFE